MEDNEIPLHIAPLAGDENHHRLLAAGFNGHCQLDPSGADLHTFTYIEPQVPNENVSEGDPNTLPAKRFWILFANWSTTYYLDGHDNWLFGVGLRESAVSVPWVMTQVIVQAFGDHNALHGCVEAHGAIYLPDPSMKDLHFGIGTTRERITQIAVAGNGNVAATLVAAPGNKSCSVFQFESIDDLMHWYRNLRKKQIPLINGSNSKRFLFMDSTPRMLVANAATFLMLSEKGDVFSWGDPRHRSLGRDTSESPTDAPGLIETLQGLNIIKIAAGGWMGAALTDKGEAYVWGTGRPGTDSTIQMLRNIAPQHVSMVQFPTMDMETTKVLDLAMGDNHLVAVVTGQTVGGEREIPGRLFVCGDNSNGQLGLGTDAPDFVEDWKEVLILEEDCRHERYITDPSFWDGRGVDCREQIGRVVCGPKSTFLFQRRKPQMVLSLF